MLTQRERQERLKKESQLQKTEEDAQTEWTEEENHKLLDQEIMKKIGNKFSQYPNFKENYLKLLRVKA